MKQTLNCFQKNPLSTVENVYHYKPLRQKMNSIHSLTCPACESHHLRDFWQQKNVPATQNVRLKTRNAACNTPCGDLLLKECTHCGMIHNAAFVPALVAYNTENAADYENNCFKSKAYRNYIHHIIRLLKTRFGIFNARIVEIACGNGEFLRLLCRATHSFGIGIDPAPPPRKNSDVVFYPEVFNGSQIFEDVTLIICRHCIEHVQNPLAFLKNLTPMLAKNPNALIYFETPRLEWILETHAHCDFFYEHCNYFTQTAIQILFRRAGLDVIQILPTFGAQYQLIFAHKNQENATNSIQDAQKELQNRLKQYQNIAIWGSGAKGVTMANVLENIACVIDINPRKQNLFIPRIGVPILSPEHAFLRYPIDAVLVVNPNYYDEIKAHLQYLHKENVAIVLL